MRARITGTGSYVPAKILSNADLESMVATSDQWITERTGIRARAVVGPGEACSDLAVKAARRALEDAKISAADPQCSLVDVDAMLEETKRMLERSSPFVRWRKQVFAELEDVLAL